MAHLRVTSLAGLTLTLVVVGCTSQEAATPASSDPTDSLPATASTTSTTTPPVTTLDATPETAVPATDAPPATEPEAATTTVDPTPSGQPTAVSTEAFAGGSADGWFYMGRWTGNGWETPIDTDGTVRVPSTSSGDDVIVHELDAAPAAGTVGAQAEACSNGTNGPTISPDPGAPSSPDFGYRSIAFEASWATQPRPVAVVDAEISAYLDAGRQVFDDLDTSAGTVKQIVVTDLDGDGDTEALVAFGGPTYSTLMLIDADSKASITVAQSVAEVTVPTTAVEGDPEPDPVTGSFSRFRTLAVTDVNGDGLMEFVAHSWIDDDATATLYTYDGTEVSGALTASC